LYSGEDRPHIKQGDLIIDEVDFSALDKGSETIDALVIRSMPNGLEKKSRNYSNANAPFFSPEALTHLRKLGIKHLLTDLPSVDREEDGGSLLAHRAFWYSGFEDDAGCTITEFIYVPDQVTDGLYLLNLQVAPFENDASPSKPVLYALQPA
jgi:kynurenine formamidase